MKDADRLDAEKLVGQVVQLRKRAMDAEEKLDKLKRGGFASDEAKHDLTQDQWTWMIPPSKRDTLVVTDVRLSPGGGSIYVTAKPKPEPKFKVGQWVRAKSDGMLGQIEGMISIGDSATKDQTTSYQVRWADERRGKATASVLIEPARPNRGEIWIRRRCDTHSDFPTYSFECGGGWPNGGSWREEEIDKCGCVYPANFGKGKKPIPVPKDGKPNP